MAVETFTPAEFEAALKDMLPGEWRKVGLIENEFCWATMPVQGKEFGLLVRSSIGPAGKSDGAGQDSIRAYIVDGEGEYWGGRNRRWVQRTSGWRKHTGDMLAALVTQIRQIEPCPSCGKMVKPFTVKKAGPTKGRCFVKCDNDACENPAWRWCDEEKPAPVETVDQGPPCPSCGGLMVRQTKNKGWKCSNAGIFIKKDRRFSGCQGVIWDDVKPAPPPKPGPPPPPQPPVVPKVEPVKPAPPPKPPVAPPAQEPTVTVRRAELERVLFFLEAGDSDKVEEMLRRFLA